MSKRTIIWLSLAGAGVVFALWLALPSQEPAYAGQPLSFWLDRLPARLVMTNAYSECYPAMYASRAAAEADQERLLQAVADARHAVKSLGRQCLPCVLRRLRTRGDSPFRVAVVRWALRLHVIKPSARSARSPDIVRGQALKALLILGEEASPAVPELVKLASSTDPSVRLAARHALTYLAPDELKRVPP